MIADTWAATSAMKATTPNHSMDRRPVATGAESAVKGMA